MSYFSYFFSELKVADVAKTMPDEEFEGRNILEYQFFQENVNFEEIKNSQKKFSTILQLLTKHQISGIEDIKPIRSILAKLFETKSTTKIQLLFDPLFTLLSNEPNKTLLMDYSQFFEQEMRKDKNPFLGKLLLLTWCKQNHCPITGWIKNTPSFILDRFLDVLDSSLREQSDKKLLFLRMILSPYNENDFIISTENEIDNIQRTLLPCPYDILMNINDFNYEDLVFATKALQIAYSIFATLSDSTIKTGFQRLLLLQNFIGFSDLTRGAFVYALFMAACNDENPKLLITFLQNMSSPVGAAIMESLFTYNTSPIFMYLNKEYGQLFYQFFASKKTKFSPLFIKSLAPLSLDLGDALEYANVFKPGSFDSLFLQYMLFLNIRFSSLKADQERDFIEDHFEDILDHIYRVRNCTFDLQNLYIPMSIELISANLTIFYSELATFLFDESAAIPLNSQVFINSTLHCLGYLISAMLPPTKKVAKTYRVADAVNSIINFIKCNKKGFAAGIAKGVKPSMAPSILIACTYAQPEYHFVNKLINDITFCEQAAEFKCASNFILSLTPSKKLVSGVLSVLLDVYSVQKRDRRVANIFFFIYLLSLKDEFRSLMKQSPMFFSFCALLKREINNTLQSKKIHINDGIFFIVVNQYINEIDCFREVPTVILDNLTGGELSESGKRGMETYLSVITKSVNEERKEAIMQKFMLCKINKSTQVQLFPWLPEIPAFDIMDKTYFRGIGQIKPAEKKEINWIQIDKD